MPRFGNSCLCHFGSKFLYCSCRNCVWCPGVFSARNIRCAVFGEAAEVAKNGTIQRPACALGFSDGLVVERPQVRARELLSAGAASSWRAAERCFRW